MFRAKNFNEVLTRVTVSFTKQGSRDLASTM